MTSEDHEQVVNEILTKGGNPGTAAVAQIHATLAVAAALRDIRDVLQAPFERVLNK